MAGNYTTTIGLEVHSELHTQTKMFCNSKNDSSETNPNVNICPVCMAHPGTLPVINEEAVKHVLRVGLALNGKIADYTEFDRKNYFYPDLPKGYQVSQYAHPLVSGGELSGIAITRVHLEEDTASSIHDDATGTTSIDFNRAGVPLMELVTEPVIGSAEEAGRFARELQMLLRYLGASEANMEKGEMRVEANISVSNTSELGTKVEVKNLNSFNIMERAVAYEIERQTAMLERGEKVIQETRGWDEKAQKTFPQRIKEGSADYRYFPDPDLPSLKISKIPGLAECALRETLPELPAVRIERYIVLGAKRADAALFTREKALGDFFDAVIEPYTAGSREVALAANYIGNDLIKIIRDTEKRDSEMSSEIPISAENFRQLIGLLAQNKVSSRAAKDILINSILENKAPEDLAREKGLYQEKSASELEKVVDEVIIQNPKVVGDFRGGKEAAIGFLLGICMKELRGAADPLELRQMLIERLSK